MFGEEWLSLSKDDVQALYIVLRITFVSKLGLPILAAARVTGKLLGKSECTICDWWSTVIDNNCTFTGSHGAYQRCLNEKAQKFVQQNAAVKGQPK